MRVVEDLVEAASLADLMYLGLRDGGLLVACRLEEAALVTGSVFVFVLGEPTAVD